MNIVIDKKKEIILLTLLLFFSIFFISADAFDGLKVYDEGVTVYGAFRVMEGDLPYLDFWTVYMPGHYYLYALVFKLFGPSLMAERITSIVLMIAIALMAYLTARKVLSAGLALLVFFFTAIWLSSFDFFGYILHPTLLFSLVSFNFFLSYLLKAQKNALFWAGGFAGLTALFRHDFGAYVFIVEIFVLVLYQIAGRGNANKESWQISMKDAGKLILGTALIFVPVAVYFLVSVPFEELYNSLITFPLEVYPDYRGIPFPAPLISYTHYQSLAENPNFNGFIKENLDHLYLYFPIIVYFAFALQLAIKSYRDSTFRKSTEFWVSTSILFLGLLFFTKVLVRSLYLHLMPTYVIAIIIFFMVLVNIKSTLANVKVNAVARILLYLLAIPALMRPFWSESMNIKNSFKRDQEQLDLTRAEHIRWDVRGSDYEKLINYVDSLVPESEKVFVGSVRHDRIFTNDVLFYFLSGRESPTKYSELHPGVVTTKEVQKEIVHDIIASGVKVIVLKDEPRMETENKSSVSSGVTLLDDFIRQHYEFDKSFGVYSVWVKRNSSKATFSN